MTTDTVFRSLKIYSRKTRETSIFSCSWIFAESLAICICAVNRVFTEFSGQFEEVRANTIGNNLLLNIKKSSAIEDSREYRKFPQQLSVLVAKNYLTFFNLLYFLFFSLCSFSFLYNEICYNTSQKLHRFFSTLPNIWILSIYFSLIYTIPEFIADPKN